MLGVGAGWNREEMEDHGTDWATRFKRMRETIEACQAIWTQEEASYHGDVVQFESMRARPKPVQQPHPIIMGGEGPLTLKRIVRYCDAWMPIDPGVAHVAPGGMTFGEQMVALQDLARQAGRDPIPVYVFFGPRDVEALKGYQDAGVTGVVMSLPPSGGEKALRRMDQIAAIREQVR